MSKIIVEVDVHNRDEPHFFEGTRAFYRCLVSQPENVPENTFIDGGDHFHRSRPSPTEYGLFYEELERKLRFGRKIFIRGNHDRASPSDGTSEEETNSIDPLAAHGIEIVLEQTSIKIGKLNVVLLPYQHDYKLSNGEKVEKSCFYETVITNACESLTPGICIYHFPDETQPMFGKARGVDLSYLASAGWRLIGADIHLQSDRYVGPPRPTRADEAGQRGRIAIIDDQTGEVEYRSCPMFLDFIRVRYGDRIKKNDEGETLLIIEDAPSTDDAYDMYGKENVWDVKLKTFEERSEEMAADVKDLSARTFEQHKRAFYEERSIDTEVQKLVDEALLVGDER